MIPPATTSTLTIEEAKLFYASKTHSGSTGVVSMRTDTIESAESGPSVIPDWNNAVLYFDEVKRQSVVEVTLLEDRLSRYLLNPENEVVDTALFLNRTQNDRLIIVKDSEGVTDYAIMKIAGTYHNTLTYGSLAANSYR